MRILHGLIFFLLFSAAAHAAIVEGVPKGWYLTGSSPASYVAGTDTAGSASGKCAVIQSRSEATDDKFGTIMQTIAADAYRGKRLRLSGMLRSADVKGWGGLWLRIDGQTDNKPNILGFDNMQSRPVLGSTQWRRYEIVLDVPQEAAGIAFGFLLAGKGALWAESLKLDEVDKSVPTTAGPSPLLPKTPANLDFQSARPRPQQTLVAMVDR